MQIKEFLDAAGLPSAFTMAVMDEVKAIPDMISEGEIARRRCLYDLDIVTIDGADAKDLDDAVSVEKIKGGCRLGVHIADVSWYVRENTALDDEAFDRGTSTYLVDTVVPMLPEKLSNGLCSLNPHKPRLTLSVFMDIDKKGAVMDYEICETVIKTRERMTYDDVTAVLEGDMTARVKYKALVPMFERMRDLALILRDKRCRRGSIDFDFPEPKVITNDDGSVKDVTVAKTGIANRIIEEFMLVANETVAKHMNMLELPLVYRVHEPPAGEKIESFIDLVKTMGYRLRTKANEAVSPKSMQNLLFSIKGQPDEQVISTMMLRSLMKARYSEENLGHYGLAAQYYCHFTSPIRRYPDLMTHRIIHLWLDGKLEGNTLARYKVLTRDAAQQSSDAEVRAVTAERDWVDYKMCEFMENRVGEEFDGIISSVTSFGFFVELPNMVEGLVRMVDLDDDYYEFDQKHMLLVGRRGGKVFHMGQEVRVRLAKVSTELKQIDFVPADNKEKEVKRSNGRKPGKKRPRKGKGRKKAGRSKQKGKA